jgi:hypothetical protein
MISVSRSRWAGIDSWAGQPLYSLAPNTVEEGMCLCGVMENNQFKATVLTAPAGTDVFLGLAYNYYTTPLTTVAVETVTVPAAPGPYTVALGNTPITPNTEMLVRDSTGQVYAFNAAHGANQFNIAGSLLTFDASAAGKTVTFTYNYSPTAQQIQFLFGDGVAGNTTASAVTGTIGLIRRGLVYTSNYDAVIDWSANPVMKVGPNGIVTSAGAGPTIPGYIYEIPSSDSPYLGINFSAP